MTHLRFLKRSRACVTEISNREFQLKNQIVIIITTVTIDTGNQINASIIVMRVI